MKDSPKFRYFFRSEHFKGLLINLTTNKAYSKTLFYNGRRKHNKLFESGAADYVYLKETDGIPNYKYDFNYVEITRKEWVKFMTRGLLPVKALIRERLGQ